MINTMKLKIKKEYLGYAIQTKTMKKTLLSNIPEFKYKSLYEGGYSHFFEEIKPKKEVKEEVKEDITREEEK